MNLPQVHLTSTAPIDKDVSGEGFVRLEAGRTSVVLVVGLHRGKIGVCQLALEMDTDTARYIRHEINRLIFKVESDDE